MERLRYTAIWANIVALGLVGVEVDGSTPAEQMWAVAWSALALVAIGLTVAYVTLRLIGHDRKGPTRG